VVTAVPVVTVRVVTVVIVVIVVIAAHDDREFVCGHCLLSVQRFGQTTTEIAPAAKKSAVLDDKKENATEVGNFHKR
jgi:hypothetical protein